MSTAVNLPCSFDVSNYCRLSTYSNAPTLAPSLAPTHLSADSFTHLEKLSPLITDINSMHASLARLEDVRLQRQRYLVSENKRDEFGKLALGAKLDRALNRRLRSQDASFTKKSPSLSHPNSFEP